MDNKKDKYTLSIEKELQQNTGQYQRKDIVGILAAKGFSYSVPKKNCTKKKKKYKKK